MHTKFRDPDKELTTVLPVALTMIAGGQPCNFLTAA